MGKVIIEKSGPVTTVWLNRPEKRNALDAELLQELRSAFTAPVAADDRVIVVRGKGSVFCAGLDMSERRETIGGGQASGIEGIAFLGTVQPDGRDRPALLDDDLAHPPPPSRFVVSP